MATATKVGRRSRGKKHCRRWADKKDQGVILNLKRRLYCDERGKPLEAPKKEQVLQ